MNPGVVVGYDRTSSSEGALDEAAAEAVRRGVGLTVVHASHHGRATSPPRRGPVADHPLDVAGLGVAEEGADRARSRHPGLTVQPHAEAGSASSVLVELSSGADVLVVGHHGHGGLAGHRGHGGHGGHEGHRGFGGFGGRELGSVALRTVNHAVSPIMVVCGAGHEARGVVLAAVDVGTAAEETLDFAFAEAAQRGARVKAISALEILWPWAPPGDTGELNRASDRAREHADAALERRLLPWRAKYPDVEAEYEVVEGDRTEVLTAATTYADLIVVGAHRRAHGHPGVRLDPIAHTLLRHADCPVAVVPHS
jgi:nucleotide-binding universal stress UspA family protein